MLDKRITRQANTFFLDYCRDRKTQLKKKLEVTIDDFDARNMLHSSFPIKEISEIYAEELKERSRFAWESMRRVLEAQNIEPTGNLAKDLEAEITYQINKLLERMFSEIRQTWKSIGISNKGPLRDYANKVELSIASARAQAIVKNRAEIDLYVDSLQNRQVKPDVNVSEVEEVVQLKPNLYGIGINLKALIRRLRRWLSDLSSQ